MGQIHGPNLGAPAANVTISGELVTTGSQIITNKPNEPRFILLNEKLDQLIGELKKMNQQLEFITDSTIREVEII